MPTFDWFNASGWPELGHVPTSADTTIIPSGRTITLSGAGAAVGKLTVQNGGTLQLNAAAGLDVYINLIVDGLLSAPVSGGGTVTVTFHATDANFVGGGTVPLDTDTGLWVTDNGQLTLVGVTKRGWSQANASLSAGATSITCQDTLTGWAVNDEVVITPTEAPSVSGYVTHDEVRTITGIAGNTITVAALSFDHPSVALPNGTTRYAEVANLTRNILITGDVTNQSHGFIRSTKAHTLSYGTFRYMGVFAVLGRYPLHFHHSNELGTTSPSTVTGWVCRDCTSHAFVPHMHSNVTFTQCVAYNTQNKAFWYDEGDESDNITFDACFVCRVYMPPNQGFRLAGFVLGTSAGNIIRDCVVCGVQGNKNAAGLEWPEGAGSPNVWDSHDVVSHNNTHDGVFNWQNDSELHHLKNFVIYHCDVGMEHGAYVNAYEFDGWVVLRCATAGLQIYALAHPNTRGLLLHDSTYDGANVTPDGIQFQDHTLPSGPPVELNALAFKNFTRAAVSVFDLPTSSPTVANFTNPALNGVNALWFDTNCNPNSTITIRGGDPGIPAGGPWVVHPASWPVGTFKPEWNAKLVAVNAIAFPGSQIQRTLVTVRTW